MSEQQREHISALADGELDSELIGPTIAALEVNADLKARWEHYALIGASLRGEAVTQQYRDIAARVRERLQTEPVPLVARPRTREPGHPAQHPPAASKRGTYAGIALAASAAFLAVYALPPLFSPSQPSQPGPSLAQMQAPTAPSAVLAPPVAGSLLALPRTVQLLPASANGYSPRWHAAEPKLEPKLDRFLINHQASSPVSGIKGLLPYATVVGYESGR